MNKLFYFYMLLLTANSLLAQPLTSYVANQANSNSPSGYNTLIGSSAGNTSMVGTKNVFIGYSTGASNTTADFNTFIGTESGYFNTAGKLNVFIGNRTGYNNVGGEFNTFIGGNAGYNNKFGGSNSFIGYQAGYSNTDGLYNAFIGDRVGWSNTTGKFNSFIGYTTGYFNTTGNENAFLGSYAGYANTTGSDNAFFGHSVGVKNTTGSNNAFFGTFAGYNNTEGNGNAFIGQQAGLNTSTGNSNTFIGIGAGSTNTTGSQNVAIGKDAFNSGSNTTGINNVFIGTGSGTGTGAGGAIVNNSVALGNAAVVSQSNAIVLGGTGVNSVSVGIGTTTPGNRLEIDANTTDRSGLRFSRLNSNSTQLLSLNIAPNAAPKVLTVDQNGDVVLAGLQLSLSPLGGRLASDLWSTNGKYLQNAGQQGVIIGNGVNKMPADYMLFVEKGILTEKVKVAVKNTNDWSDRVFEKRYKLRDLDEVDGYIQKHGHLPGIPSAVEVVDKGIDVAKMDAKLLEKIEELTLYSIKQQKTIQQQQVQLNELKQLINQLIKK